MPRSKTQQPPEMTVMTCSRMQWKIVWQVFADRFRDESLRHRTRTESGRIAHTVQDRCREVHGDSIAIEVTVKQRDLIHQHIDGLPREA